MHTRQYAFVSFEKTPISLLPSNCTPASAAKGPTTTTHAFSATGQLAPGHPARLPRPSHPFPARRLIGQSASRGRHSARTGCHGAGVGDGRECDGPFRRRHQRREERKKGTRTREARDDGSGRTQRHALRLQQRAGLMYVAPSWKDPRFEGASSPRRALAEQASLARGHTHRRPTGGPGTRRRRPGPDRPARVARRACRARDGVASFSLARLRRH